MGIKINDPKKLEEIKKINKTIVHGDEIDNFEEQLDNLNDGVFDKSMPMVVLDNSKSLSYINRINIDKTITMRPSKVAFIENEHFLSLDTIKSIDIGIANSFFAVDSRTRKDSVVVFIDNDTHANLVVALDTKGKAGYIEVNLLSSAYERRNVENYLYNTYNDNLYFYKNEKTEHFINSRGLQLPKDLKYALSNNYNRQTFNKSQVELDVGVEVNYENLKEICKEKIDGKHYSKVKANSIKFIAINNKKVDFFEQFEEMAKWMMEERSVAPMSLEEKVNEKREKVEQQETKSKSSKVMRNK